MCWRIEAKLQLEISQAGGQRSWRLLAIAVLRTDWRQTDSGRRDADSHSHASGVANRNTRQVTLDEVTFCKTLI